jgi:hypothetical protein
MNKFEKLLSLNVNDKVEKKNGLSYLSWSYAWDYFMKEYPDATYEIVKFDGKPYYADNSGAMCYTKVTANGLTHEMWLPIMDGANNAMKSEAYEYDTKYGKKTVKPFTMFDVNKTIMRCLVKNLAMFGLGLYIYSGEDLPEYIPTAEEKIDLLQKIKTLISETSTNEIDFLKFFKVSATSELSYENQLKAIQMLEAKKAKSK